MVRRVTPSQMRSMIRQAEQKQRRATEQANRAIRDFNRAVDEANRKQRQAVNEYNREARAHNARVRANRARLQSELRQLSSQPARTIRYTGSTRLVSAVEQTFMGVESAVESGRWEDSDNVLDLVEGEAADSVAALNGLLNPDPAQECGLQDTELTNELNDIHPDLQARWSGALFALHPSNPDAARHFCTSARELVATLLDNMAPDAAVKTANPNYFKTPNGGVSRRAKIHYCLSLKGSDVAELAAFVEADIDGVVGLFDDFNRGTHGVAGSFPLAELVTLKQRVEQAVKFLHRLLR